MIALKGRDPTRPEIQCSQCRTWNGLSVVRREDDDFDFQSRSCWRCHEPFSNSFLDALLEQCIQRIFKKDAKLTVLNTEPF